MLSKCSLAQRPSAPSGRSPASPPKASSSLASDAFAADTSTPAAPSADSKLNPFAPMPGLLQAGAGVEDLEQPRIVLETRGHIVEADEPVLKLDVLPLEHRANVPRDGKRARNVESVVPAVGVL